MAIKQAIFMPISDNILACFQDDAIHIWGFPSFQCVKQVVPDTWKGDSIRSLAFTRNGRAMVLGGASRQLVIFTVEDWDCQRVILLPDYVSKVEHLEFLPQAFDSGANQILVVLLDSGKLLFLDLTKETIMESKTENNISSFTCSRSGKYVVCNTVSGESKIFSGSQMLSNVVRGPGKDPAQSKNEALNLESVPLPEMQPNTNPPKKPIKLPSKKSLSKINEQFDTVLDINRLRRILKEFYEYSDQYRGLIWRSILRLPGNKGPWKSLSERPLHPAAQDLSLNNLCHNKILYSCLQSVISCLAYWSPVFGELPYLPQFLLPFIKAFHSDKFVCFEVATTLIINWCQHWFEYLSFPPVNVLGMIENVLTEHDHDLVSMFCNAGVTSRQYAWSLLSTAFSEVLTSAQWKQLWDHVLSNPPWFLLFAVVAYNMCCRASLKTCSSKQDFDFFFQHQNPINMKYFLKKCYDLMEKTSSENHPRQYLKPFSPLSKGNYPVFSEFPKFIVNYQKEQRDAIRREEENILKEQQMVLSRRLACEETRMREKKAQVHEARLLEAEKAANAALQAEEERLAEKRKQLASLRRELRLQEEESLAAAKVELMEHHVKQRSAELDRLHRQLHARAKQSGLDREGLNEEVHEQFSRLRVKKQELQQRLGEYSLKKLARSLMENTIPSDEIFHLRQQQQLLSEEIQKLRKESGHSRVKADNVDIKMAELDSIQQRVDLALAKKAFLQQDLLMNAEHCLEEAHAATKLKKLEHEVEDLTQKLALLTNSTDPHAKCKSELNEKKVLNINEPTVCFESSPAAGAALSLHGSDFYSKEKCAVTSAMELRRSLLSSWN
ncbi:TBC1 domain family member 31 isoform X2 [Thrips palmi]|nr:TBC1 domain family member 31 isoform X2 [Thrips palmi]